MVHDQARVNAVRARVVAQAELIKSLQAKIVKGELGLLEVALFETEDIESLLLRDLDRQDRSPAEESRWLSYTERILSIWGPQLQRLQEQFNRYGDVGVEIVGG